jgi:transposase
MHFQLLPYERVVTLLDDLFGTLLSEGTLCGATKQAFTALAPVEEAILAALKGAKNAHFDETGQHIGGLLHWLHVTGTARLTYYKSHKKRGKAALDAIGILPVFTGRAIHDGWSAYRHYGCAHALCNSHHLRELTAVFEQQQQAWAGEMKTLLVAIKHAVDTARYQGQSRLPPLRECAFEGRYRALLRAGYKANPPPLSNGKPGREKQGSARNLLLRLDEYQSCVLAFLYDFSVPFDNNLAERDIRMMKVKQKVSGGFRSQEGADAFNRIRGYISTLRKQGQQVLSALNGVFSGQPIMPDLTP